jgi:cold-inducible RNA-binding protein
VRCEQGLLRFFRLQIINDRETGRSRGFGFVTLSSEQSMRDAIQGMNGKELGGRTITVNKARPRHSRGHEGDGGSGQRRNGSGNSDRYWV